MVMLKIGLSVMANAESAIGWIPNAPIGWGSIAETSENREDVSPHAS
jgi:hypothetical protein